jgi:hypothetical protein
MADVVRFEQDIQEVVYTVGPDSVRKAILAWLYDTQGGVFTEETELRFCSGGSVAVTTRFASVDTHPKDGDVEQAPLVSGAVPKGGAHD